jgi:WD40 repeat protein
LNRYGGQLGADRVAVEAVVHSSSTILVRSPSSSSRRPLGGGEVLARHTGLVLAAACTVLPGGQPVAVTGSGDDTVRVWDLLGGDELPAARLYLSGSVRQVAVAADGTLVLAGAGVVAATPSEVAR